jgi:outer membrane protein
MRIYLILLAVVPLQAQDPLSLRDAVRLALKENRAVAASAAGVDAAESRITQARGGSLPKVNYAESFSRSNNPVYVFSSLLSQRQFTERNFVVGSLNNPDFFNNFQSQVTVDQPLYDAGQTRAAVRSAQLAKKMTGEDSRRVAMDVIATVARTYYGALLGEESLKAAEQAVRSAEADLRRAESVRQAGMSTDVDVLSIRVHLAAVTEMRISRAANLDVARAALNDALGVPLDTAHRLTSALAPADRVESTVDAAEKDAVSARPELRQTRFAVDLAHVQAGAARSAFLPQVSARGVFEADRERFVTRGGANWMAAVSLRWNLFNGFTDRARVAEASSTLRRAEADAQRAGSAVKLQVRRAWAEVRAAGQRIEVARAAVAQAEESLRITQNRYTAGMSNVTDLLRTETAVLESKTRFHAAVHDQRVAATMLEYAAGRLTVDSEVLN